MPRCEDYPCCGHEANDCPPFGGSDDILPYPCIECGEAIPIATRVRGHESYCQKCFSNPRTFHDNENCPGCGYCDGDDPVGEDIGDAEA
jgi:hypothetical protein